MPNGVCANAADWEDEVSGIIQRRSLKFVMGTWADNDHPAPKAISSLKKVDIKLQSSRAIFSLVALFVMSASAIASPLSLATFQTVASRCAPNVPVNILAGIAKTESGFDPLALHDNTTGVGEESEDSVSVTENANQWVKRGDSVDIGLMQINSANLPALGMNITTALDACSSMAAGAAVLKAAYARENVSDDQQTELLIALSRYNTGTPFDGIMNGYARTVLNNAETEVPTGLLLQRQATVLMEEDTSLSWDVSAEGTYVQTHGASWLIDLAPSASVVISATILRVPAVSMRQFAVTYGKGFSTPTLTR